MPLTADPERYLVARSFFALSKDFCLSQQALRSLFLASVSWFLVSLRAASSPWSFLLSASRAAIFFSSSSMASLAVLSLAAAYTKTMRVLSQHVHTYLGGSFLIFNESSVNGLHLSVIDGGNVNLIIQNKDFRHSLKIKQIQR